MGTPSPNYGWTIPTDQADSGTWGQELNSTLNAIDAQVFANQGVANAAKSEADAALPVTNGTATGLKLVAPSSAPDPMAAGYLGSPINGIVADYTLQLSDCGKTVQHNNANAHTLYIPASSSTNFPLGTVIGITNYSGSGTLYVQPNGGVTLNAAGSSSTGSRSLSGMMGVASLQKIGSPDVWLISGVGVS